MSGAAARRKNIFPAGLRSIPPFATSWEMGPARPPESLDNVADATLVPFEKNTTAPIIASLIIQEINDTYACARLPCPLRRRDIFGRIAQPESLSNDAFYLMLNCHTEPPKMFLTSAG